MVFGLLPKRTRTIKFRTILYYNMTNFHVKKKSLSDSVVSRIREHIIRNDLRVGDRLPTEMEMANQFGVSRISIREATKALGFFGVIKSAPRRGLTVGPVDMKRVADVLGFQFALDNYPRELLLKARLIIEIGSLQYTMKAVSSDNVLFEELIAMCDKLEMANDPDVYIEQDVNFHRKIVQSSGVEPLIAFNDVLQAFFHRYRDEIVHRQDHDRQEGARMHKKIVMDLRNGNLIDAESKLRQHLEVHMLPIKD